MLKDRLLQGRWILEDEERKISQVSNKNLALDEKEIIRNQKLQVKSATNRRIEELEREIKILDLEKERRLRQLAEDELHRNEEFKDYYNQNLVLLKKKEVASLSELQHAENQNELKRAEERAEMILNEKKKQLNQRVDQQKALLNIEKENAHREIEERLFTMRKEQEQKAVEDEKRLQEEIITIEEERRAEKQLEQQILFKEKEIREKNIFEKVLHDTEKRLGDSSEYIPQANAKAQDLYRESISRDQAITNKPNYQNMYQNYAKSHSSLCSSCHSHNSNSRCTSSEDIPTPPLPVRMTQHFSSESENSDESFNLSQSEGSLGERFVRHTTPAYPSQIDF